MSEKNRAAAIDAALMAGASMSDLNNILGRQGYDTFQQVQPAEVDPAEVDPMEFKGASKDVIDEVAGDLFGGQETTIIGGDVDRGGEDFMAQVKGDTNLAAAYEELAGQKLVDTSFLSSFKKRYKEAMPLGEALDIMEVSARPHEAGEIEYLDKDWMPQVPKYISPTEKYGKDWFKITDKERRERVLEKRREDTNNYLKTTVPTGAGAFIGDVLGNLMDWSTILPGGASVKGAMMIGGGLGAADVVATQLAVKGEIEPEDVILMAGIGAATGGLVQFGTRKVTGWMRDRASAGVPVNAEQIAEQVMRNDQINRAYEIMVEETLEEAPIPTRSTQVADELPDFGEVAKEVNDAFEIMVDEALAKPIKHVEYALKNTDNANLEGSIHDLRLEATSKHIVPTADQVKKAKDIETAWAAREGTSNFPDDFQITKDIQASKKRLEKENITFRYKTPEPRNEAIKEALIKEQDRIGKETDLFTKLASRKEGGFGDLGLMKDMTATSLGAIVGYAWDGPEGALFGAIAGLGMAHSAPLAKKVYNRVGKLLEPGKPPSGEKIETDVRKFVNGRYISKPETAFNGMGKAGREFVRRFKSANEDLNMTISRGLMEIDKTLYDVGLKSKTFIFTKDMPEMKQIPQILNKTMREEDASPMAVATANKIRTIFKKTLKDSLDSGVITPKRYNELLTKAEKEGYWPRVYNDFYLNSEAGKKKWMETLTDYKWTEVDAKNALKTLTGESDLKAAVLAGKMTTKDGKVYKMPRAMAQKLYDKRRDVATSTRSAHLERERKILLPDKVLQPFLVDDVQTVMSDYLRDTYKRVHLAQWFGSRDQEALKLFKGVGEINPRFQKDMQEVYYTMAGDLDASETIKKFVDMPLLMKDAYGRATSFETLKLVFAPVVNATQATVNGAAMLERVTSSPAASLRIYKTALGRSFTQEGKEFAKRVGAMAESTIMQAMGELSSQQHSILHKQFNGLFTPLNTLNQPTKFLKAIGFTSVENAQRILGANMGRALVEDIIETNTGYLAKLAGKRGISPSMKRTFEKNKKTLTELGINPEVHPSQIQVGDIERAAQRFSNEINFINTPDQMPIFLQNPYLKPVIQFKSFTVKHSAFLIKNLVDPIRKNPKDLNSYRPAMTYLMVVGAPLGMTVDEARRFIQADDRELTMLQRFIRGATSIGGLGILTDLAGSSAWDRAGLTSWAMGPTAGDISEASNALIKSVTGGTTIPLERFGAGIVPYPGKKAIQKHLFDKSSSSPYSDTYEGTYRDVY